MESSLALTIIGSTMGLVGMIFIFIPKLVNNKIMGQIPVEAVDISALFRIILGGSATAIGFIAIYCRNIPSLYANDLLFSLGVGFIVINSQIISAKFRGFGKELPIPPIVLFFILATIAFISS